jgi:hypothetical protein
MDKTKLSRARGGEIEQFLLYFCLFPPFCELLRLMTGVIFAQDEKDEKIIFC